MKEISLSLFCMCSILLVLAVSGCGDDYSSSYENNDLSNTGSYACSLKWPEDVPTLESTSAVSRGIDCDAAGVATVAFTFYDGSGSYLTGDEWSCSLHEGTVDGIPAGTSRRLVVTGEDASGAMLYWGEKTGITVVAGQTTQGGEIEMEYVYGTVPSIPTNVAATAAGEQVTISWGSVSGATSYNIYWSTSQGVTTDTGTKISTSSSPYTHTGLTNDTTYYYVVTAENSYGETDESDEVSATPSATGEAPSAPTNVAATAADEQVTISWDTSSGATSYNIYWATYSGVSKADYEGVVSDATNPYTHTGLTNGTTYYYVVTAENSYGESDESDEVNATPEEGFIPLLSETGTISYDGEKHFYQVSVSSGQNLFVTVNLANTGQNFYLYVKYGSLPTTSDYDARSITGEDEAIQITSTQSGTYYIMVYVSYYYSGYSGDYTITASSSLTSLTLGTSTAGAISYDGEKHFYQVSVSSGQNLFITVNLANTGQNFYLYVKYGSLPTTSDYDARSITGEDEAIQITSTQSGTYYIMVYASYYYSGYSGDYTITASTSL